MMNIFHQKGLVGFIGLGLMILISTLIFSNNITKSASEFQFRSYRDGSEALVLGKIFADLENISTNQANLGFIEKDKITKNANVLANYMRIDYPNSLIPVDINDLNWSHGFGISAPIFLLARAEIAKLGYAENELKTGQKVHFSNGETRTITKIEVKNSFIQVYYSGAKIDFAQLKFPSQIKILDASNYVFDEYKSQYGLQGIFFSWFYKHFYFFSTVYSLQFLCAALTAIVLVLLCREYGFVFGKAFGVIFLISVLESPWIVSIARNLYWVPFLWFFPSLITMRIYRKSPDSKKSVLYILFLTAIFLKSLTGYEYLSSIVLFSLAIFFVDPFYPIPKYDVKVTIKIISVLFVLSILGFGLALLFHGSIRSDSIVNGVKNIFQSEAIKYTQLSKVVGNISLGMDMTLWDVLKKYIVHWESPVILRLNNPFVFVTLIIFTCLSILLQYLISDRFRHRDFALVVFMALPPLSWLILMKGHSVIHTHLNYVLWNFGFLPTIIFVIWRGLWLLITKYQKVFS
ncbi:hypothetical protein [Legionella sainthelensi]|uniref:Transmembrane protein n=1 Tax=Legionella sainthelensi TaxID=28087 RepID=A0A2H5FHJ5_9GAMM|nr:hypothetical protein [Legionella sainthelensi]AUH71021.1 hypothetical protein CAB17_02320 [Legionella sainthelensi]